MTPILPPPLPVPTASPETWNIPPARTAALPTTAIGSFDELLRNPDALVNREDGREVRLQSVRLLVGGVVALMAYGAAAGFFAGGTQVLIACFKTPLIVLASLLLCLPSLYVFSTLSGAEISPSKFWSGIAGFFGMMALLLVGLLPVNWLFSVSSRSLWFVLCLHLGIWMVAVMFAYRFLRKAFFRSDAPGLAAWILLFVFVSFQVATFFRPLLWRADDETVFDFRKMTFLEHFGKAASVVLPEESASRTTIR